MSINGDMAPINRKVRVLPSPHASSHASGGSDPVSLDAGQIVSGVFSESRIPHTFHNDFTLGEVAKPGNSASLHLRAYSGGNIDAYIRLNTNKEICFDFDTKGNTKLSILSSGSILSSDPNSLAYFAALAGDIIFDFSTGTDRIVFDTTNNIIELKNKTKISGNEILDSGGTTRIRFDTANNKVVIPCNLDVQGDMTVINTQNVSISDRIITLNEGETGNGVANGTGQSGIEIDRGSANDNAQLLFDEPNDKFVFKFATSGNMIPIDVKSLQISGTQVIDSSRNLANIGTISASGSADVGSLQIGGTEIIDSLKNLKNITSINSSGDVDAASFGVSGINIIDSNRKLHNFFLDNTNIIIVAASDSPYTDGAKYVCDGTNDEAEINQAINDLGTNGGIVLLLPGTYYIANPVYLKSKVWLKGSGANVTKLIWVGAEEGEYSIVVANHKDQWSASGYAGGSCMRVSDLLVDGNGKIVLGIGFLHCKNVVVERVHVTNIANWHGVEVNSVANAWIRNCLFYDFAIAKFSEEAVQFDAIDNSMGTNWLNNMDTDVVNFDGTPCLNIHIVNNKFDNVVTAVGQHNGVGHIHKNIVIANNTMHNLKQAGIYIRDIENAVIANNQIYKITPTFDYSGLTGAADGQAITIRQYARNVVIANNTLFDLDQYTTVDSTNVGMRGISLRGTSSDISQLRDIIIIGNTIISVSRYAFAIDFCKSVVVANNILYGAGLWSTSPGDGVSVYGSERVTISNNIIQHVENSRHGVRIWNNTTRVLIIGNQITDISGYAVKEDSGCDYTKVWYNILQGTSGSYSLTGSNSQAVGNASW